MSVPVSHARHLWSLVSEAPRSAHVSVGQRAEWPGSQPVLVPVGAALPRASWHQCCGRSS